MARDGAEVDRCRSGGNTGVRHDELCDQLVRCGGERRESQCSRRRRLGITDSGIYI